MNQQLSKQFIFSTGQMLTLVLVTLSGILTVVALHGKLVLGFFPGLLYLFLISLKKGAKPIELGKAGVTGALKAKEVMIILALIGMLLPSWELAGTIPQLVSLSLTMISVTHFYLLSFLATMLLSMVLGTAVGTLSALGIPIITTAQALGIPVEVTAGALLSGAVVGDRTSPLSSAFQLLSYTVELPVPEQFRSIFPTAVISVLISIGSFMYLDAIKPVGKEQLLQKITGTEFSFIFILPAIILIALVLMKVKIRWAFISSIVMAIALAIGNGTSVSELLNRLFFGIDGLGGGVLPMFWMILFITAAGFYNGILEEYQIIQPFIDKWFRQDDSLFKSSAKTMAAAGGVAVIGCNQTLPILLTGRSLFPFWKSRFNQRQFARVLADSAMVLPPLIPWNLMGIMSSTIIGVPVLHYVPFAVFPVSLIVVTLTYSAMRQHQPDGGPLPGKV